MNNMDNNKGTPTKETNSESNNYTNTEHGNNPEINQPNPSYTPNVFPDEMPVREGK